MYLTCTVCSQQYKVDSIAHAKRITENRLIPICRDCHRKQRTSSAVKKLNAETQLELLSLIKRVEDCEQKFSHIEYVIEGVVADKTNNISKEVIAVAYNTIHEYLEKEFKKREDKLQSQILKLNNKIIKMEESKCEEN